MSSDVTQGCDPLFLENTKRMIVQENKDIDKYLIERAGEDCRRLLDLRRAAAELIYSKSFNMMEPLTQDDRRFIAKILYEIIPRLGDILGSLLN